MADKRMFSKSVIESDAFLDMPMSSQALYFHLALNADDDGFIDNPKMIQRITGATNDDLNILIAKKFLIAFENGVFLVSHWRVHNVIKSDRYKPTIHLEEKMLISEDINRKYVIDTNNNSLLEYNLNQKNGVSGTTDKDRLDKNRYIYLDSQLNGVSDSKNGKSINPIYRIEVINKWNELAEFNIATIRNDNKLVDVLEQKYSLEEVLNAIDKIKQSDYLLGRTEHNIKLQFRWFVRNVKKINLDKFVNYEKPERKKKSVSLSKYQSFPQNEYDFDALEKEFVTNG